MAYIVDCVEFRIARPTAKEDELAVFSHKPKMPAIKYEGAYLLTLFNSKTPN